jgi:hypothetical protein
MGQAPRVNEWFCQKYHFLASSSNQKLSSFKKDVIVVVWMLCKRRRSNTIFPSSLTLLTGKLECLYLSKPCSFVMYLLTG